MKSTVLYFEDEEHALLIKKKKELGLNWHDFILTLLEEKNLEKKEEVYDKQ